jgi:hypothetical protein
MAYYWLPKTWRNKFERTYLTPKQRKFIDVGERVNRYPVRLLQTLYSRGPSRGKAQVIHRGALPGNPGARKRRAEKISRGVPSKRVKKESPQVKSESSKQDKKMVKRGGHVARLTGTGHYQGKFVRPRKRVKKVKYPCIVKDERAVSASDPKCQYVVHASHPPKYVMRMIGMALTHKYFASNGIWIRNWEDAAGIPTGVGTSTTTNLRVVSVSQADANSSSDPDFTILATMGGSDSYLQFADKLSDGLINLVTNSSEDLFISSLQWRSTADPTNPDVNIAYQVWDATEINIEVYGKSMLNLQNRTRAGDTGDSSLTTSIYSNPLHGKHYHLKGNGARIRDLGVGSANTSAQFVTDSATGLVALGSQETILGLQAQDALSQPPLPNYFFNCSGSSYIRLEPGAIKQSTCYTTVTKTLNKWLRVYFSFLQSATTISSIGQYVTSGIGKSRCLGLEKVADMGSGNEIALAGERDATYMSRCWFKKRRFTASTNNAL